ncbi:Aldehyde dehydrogenase PuuC (plasmid) [Croceibacterium atlanticum]|uniref:Aldehyde dehydrogenase PuuC n=1 Tax=Croceibacterium atlanticum TaxID=1267766 RepID=A0A0F7KX86_9SPHN|nr:Aldehyde dehydrogenase PuuC [Croceibacterium atlanticum]
MLIGGEWVESADGQTIDVEDPATTQVFTRVPGGSAEDIDRAVKAARRAFESRSWARMRPLDRGKIIENIARKIEENGHELALLESYDNGKTVHHALSVDVPAAVDIFRYMAGWTSKIGGRSTRSPAMGSNITAIPFASRLALSGRSSPGTIRWQWLHGRLRRRWLPAAPSFSSRRNSPR